MITELMIILIVVGAVIIFIAWTSARRRKNDDDERRDAEESTEKFKQDLEKTANEIIGRMETQAARLEKLLKESEKSRTQIEGRIAELKKLSRKIDEQALELRNLTARADSKFENVDSIQRQPARQPVKSPITPPPISITPPTQNFSKILEQSMTEPAPPKRSEQLTKAAPVRKISEMPAKPTPAQSEFENSGDSAVVREMLMDGMTVEEIARETGLGRGAILLIQQMMRRKVRN